MDRLSLIETNLESLADLSNPLRAISSPLMEINQSIHDLVHHMMAIMATIPYATGLSAIQIGLPLRLAVINMERVPGQDIVIINPRVLKIWGRPTTRTEGCLSLPHYKGPVRRRNRISVAATDLQGVSFELEAKGYFAAVLQHELDHMDGVLYLDRMDTLPVRTYGEEYVHGKSNQEGDL